MKRLGFYAKPFFYGKFLQHFCLDQLLIHSNVIVNNSIIDYLCGQFRKTKIYNLESS